MLKKMNENKKLKIGMDIDDTIWKFNESFINFLNFKNRTNYKIDNFEGSFEDLFNLSQDEISVLLEEFEYSLEFGKFDLIEGVKEFLEELKQIHEIIFITARSNKFEEITRKKLVEHFGEFDFPIHFLYDENYNKLNSKADLCIEHGVDYMIDDFLQNLLSCSNKGIKSFLLDRPWNQTEELDENIIRVKEWNELLNKLNELSELKDNVHSGEEK